MINRQNWQDVCAWLRYCGRGLQQDALTVLRYRGLLRHLLEWADATPLGACRETDPIYPAYLVSLSLSPATVTKALATARTFYTYARLEWPVRYKNVRESWIQLLRPPRAFRLQSQLQTHPHYSLDEVRALLAVPAENLRAERTQAAVAMLFASGMRDGALMSLPISCVNVERREIHQLPELGVQTKGRKAALTYLLDLPDLLDVIRRWDARLRAQFPVSALWMPLIDFEGFALLETHHVVASRTKYLRDDLRELCERADLPYLSPHKFRHGHVMWARRHARDMDDLKAISQNVMHSSVTITDGVYGNFDGADVKNIIARLGQSPAAGDGIDQKLDELLRLLRA